MFISEAERQSKNKRERERTFWITVQVPGLGKAKGRSQELHGSHLVVGSQLLGASPAWRALHCGELESGARDRTKSRSSRVGLGYLNHKAKCPPSFLTLISHPPSLGILLIPV